MYGIFLSLMIFIGAILYLETDKKTLKILYGIILASGITSSIFALNRGSWIAIVAGVIFAYPIYRKYLSLKWFIVIFSVIAVLAAGVVIDRFMELQENRLGADTFGGRVATWALIVNNFSEIPVLGYGAGAVQSAMIKLFHLDVVPHNDYLRLLMEMGLLAPLIYILILVKELIINIRLRVNDSAWHVNYFTLVMIIYMIIISFVQNVIHNVVVFPMFLVCCHLASRYVVLPDKS